MGLYSATKPSDRNYGQETRDTLQAQIDLAPQLYDAEATYQPKYAQLEAGIWQDLLSGDAATGRRGLMDIYSNDVAPALYESEIGAVEKYGGRATAAMRNANPDQARLIDELNRQASEELRNPYAISAGERAAIEEGVLGDAALRGFGRSGLDAYNAVGALGERGRAMAADRRRFAGDVVNINASATLNPFEAILGRNTATAGGLLGGGVSSGMGGGPSLFNSESDYAQGMFGQQYGADAAARLATAANRTQGIGYGKDAS